jgi:hypothetical protein
MNHTKTVNQILNPNTFYTNNSSYCYVDGGQMILEDIYLIKCMTKSDINEHLPIIKEYGKKVDHITEMGVRSIVSTYALLAAKPKKMISYDIVSVDTSHIHSLAPSTEYKFIVGDTRQVIIEPTDLLFIDTLHNYEQLKIELKLHAPKTSKFIILHDTVTFGERGETSANGLNKAIGELLDAGEWVTDLHLKNNNGLTVLRRII